MTDTLKPEQQPFGKLFRAALLLIIGAIVGALFTRYESSVSAANVVQQRLELAYLEAERNGDWGTDAIKVVDSARDGQISLKLARIHLDAIRRVLSDPNIIDQIPQRTLQVFSLYIEKAEDVQSLQNEMRIYVATHHGRSPHGGQEGQTQHFNTMLRKYLISFTATALASRLSLAGALAFDTQEAAGATEARRGAEQDIKLAREGLVRVLEERASPTTP